MNEHEYWLERISRLLDGDLSPQEQDALWEHLAQCPDCARAYETYQQMTAALRGEQAEPPAALSRRVMARVEADAASIPWEADEPVRTVRQGASVHRLRPWRKVAVAACFVALVAVGAVTGLFGRRAASSGAADMASYLPEAKSDSFTIRLPGEKSAPQEVQQAQDAQQAPAADAQAQPNQAQPEQPQPPEQPLSEQEPVPAQGPLPPEAASRAAAPEADGELALGEAEEDSVEADAGQAADMAPENGIMTVMEPAPSEGGEPVPVYDGAGQAAGCIPDTGALAALLNGQPWQGESPQTLYTLTLDGVRYAFAADEDGGLLWQRAGDEAFTLSTASLARLQALIVPS